MHSATVAALILTQCRTCTIKGHPASRADVSKTFQRAWRRSSFGSTSLQEGATCANRKPGLASTCVVQVISAQGREFEDNIRCKREHRESEMHVPARYFWC